MFEELIKIADELDSLGLSDKADAIDSFLGKLAESGMHTVPTYVADDDMEDEEDEYEDDQSEKISPAEVIEAIQELTPEERMEVFSWMLREEIESFNSDSEEEEPESDDEEDFEFEEDEEASS